MSMSEFKDYNISVPVVNKKERDSLVSLTERYNKLIEPGPINKVGVKIGNLIPDKVKEIGAGARDKFSDAEIFAECMKIVASGFDILEKQAAGLSISETSIVRKVNKTIKDNEIDGLDEVCLARSYNISKLVASYKRQDLGIAFVEGGVTGYFGFAGIPFNMVLSLFLYYRAVQSIAMFYGYDTKNDATELAIASGVFMNALSPKTAGTDGISGMISKVMVMTEITTIQQVSKKSWSEMIARGGVPLLLAQMRALANKSVQKTLEQSGRKGLENSLFKEVFEQIGQRLAKKSITKSVPYIGAAIGALFDTAQMNTVLEYADVFYNRRYVIEKEARINSLIGYDEQIYDIEIE